MSSGGSNKYKGHEAVVCVMCTRNFVEEDVTG